MKANCAIAHFFDVRFQRNCDIVVGKWQKRWWHWVFLVLFSVVLLHFKLIHILKASDRIFVTLLIAWRKFACASNNDVIDDANC